MRTKNLTAKIEKIIGETTVMACDYLEMTPATLQFITFMQAKMWECVKVAQAANQTRKKGRENG